MAGFKGKVQEAASKITQETVDEAVADTKRRLVAEYAREKADLAEAAAIAKEHAKTMEREVRRVRDLLPNWAKIAGGVLVVLALVGWVMALK